MTPEQKAIKLLQTTAHFMGEDSETYAWVQAQLEDGADVDDLLEAIKNQLRTKH